MMSLAGLPARALFCLMLVGTIVGLTVSVSCDDDQWDDLLAVRVLDHEFTTLRQYDVLREDGSYESQVLRVESAGDGVRFRITLQTLDGLARSEMPDGGDLARRFDSLEKHYLAGGGYRLLYQVGFRVHDRELLCDNYVLIEVDDPGLDITEQSLHYVAASNEDDRSHWRVDFSAEAGREGFVIGYEEFRIVNGAREVLSRMTTLEFDYGRSGMWGRAEDGPVVSREVLDSVDDLVARADIPIYYPATLPVGFQLVAVEVDVLRTDATFTGKLSELTYYRMVFSDGIETIELFQSKPTAYTADLLRIHAGIPDTGLDILRRDFLTVSEWSIPGPGHEIAIEGRRWSERMLTILHGLCRLN